jgi:hypothetical protein
VVAFHVSVVLHVGKEEQDMVSTREGQSSSATSPNGTLMISRVRVRTAPEPQVREHPVHGDQAETLHANSHVELSKHSSVRVVKLHLGTLWFKVRSTAVM